MPRLPDDDETNNHFEEAMASLHRAIDRVVRLRVDGHASFEEIERATLKVTNEGARRHLQDRLQKLADRQPDVFRFNGLGYEPHQPGEVVYHSLCGPLGVRRWTYRRQGVRNGPTLVPLEIVAGIVERASPAFGYYVGQGYAQMSSRELCADLKAAYRCPPSRSCLEDMAKRLGTSVRESLDELEPIVRMQEQLPEQACAVAIGLDRTSVPMEEDRAPDQPPNSRRKCRNKPYERTPRGPIDVHYRMAYVGTVTITDAEGEALQTHRYAVPAHEGTDDLLPRMMADVHNALLQKPTLHVGVVLDGAPELWGLMWDALDNEPLVTHYHQAVDRYHLNERLAAALHFMEPDPHKRRHKLRRWNERLDDSDRAIDSIENELDRFQKTLSPKKWKEFEPSWSYVHGHKSRMRYATLRKLGLPVGSGVTEGACKSMIAARAKRSGQRWRPEGISAVLALRSLHQSDRLDAYWPHFVRWKNCADLMAN